MDDFTFVQWLRTTLALLGVVVAVWLTGMTLRFIRDLSLGQKLWAGGAIGVLFYAADACREAAKDGLEFRWRLVPLMLGLIAYLAYLLESRTQKRKRFGGRPFDPHK